MSGSRRRGRGEESVVPGRPGHGARPWWPALLATSLLAAGGCGSDAPTEAEALLDVLALEDARPLDPEGVAALVQRTRYSDAATRRFAVRALGRLEDPAVLSGITPLLSDDDATVRATAAWATAQAVQGGEGTPAVAPLLAAAATESAPEARRELARSLGRVRPQREDAGAVVSQLVTWASEPGLSDIAAVGVALGLEGLTRATGPAASDDRVYEALTVLATRQAAPGSDPEPSARTRAVALLALGQRGRITGEQVATALRDPVPDVRGVGARFLSSVDGPERTSLAGAALSDPEAFVRVEALRVLATAERTPTRCARLVAAASADDDPTPARLVAIDALAAPCPGAAGDEALELLDSLATDLPAEVDSWHASAHALTALARLAPERARSALPEHARHVSPFARARAAVTAATLGEVAILRDLADDPAPNVRTAALPGLFVVERRDLDGQLMEELSSTDGQLLITVSELLEGTQDEGAAAAALDAFDRISATRRETARDARMALLELVAAVGGPELAPRLEPYLTDFDPVVAERVASLLSAWTGDEWTARPVPLERLPLPSAEDIEAMAASRVVLHMAGGGEIVVQPLPYLAPTNAHRFVRLAREAYFDGLTFHRVAPNFVIQGGSPSANEYAGDGPYTRDEIGRASHWRGTVGLSTRGRDTGDGQIFVNLVDNIRLDHDYTIFGRVVSGMDVVDAVLAGDVIQRVEVRP